MSPNQALKHAQKKRLTEISFSWIATGNSYIDSNSFYTIMSSDWKMILMQPNKLAGTYGDTLFLFFDVSVKISRRRVSAPSR